MNASQCARSSDAPLAVGPQLSLASPGGAAVAPRPPVAPPGGDGAAERQERDRQLVRAIAAGDQASMSELYDRYSGVLLGLVRQIVGESGGAEEVLQDAFLQAWKQSSRYDPVRASVSTWLVLIARSRAIDRIRARGVRLRTLTGAKREKARLHAAPEGPREILRQERGDRLRAVLEALPAEQRRVLELAYYDGLTQAEISAREDLPLGTVKTRSRLALRRLQRALRREHLELL